MVSSVCSNEHDRFIFLHYLGHDCMEAAKKVVEGFVRDLM